MGLVFSGGYFLMMLVFNVFMSFYFMSHHMQVSEKVVCICFKYINVMPAKNGLYLLKPYKHHAVSISRTTGCMCCWLTIFVQLRVMQNKTSITMVLDGLCHIFWLVQ